MSGGGPPVDWYRTSFSPDYCALYWEEGGEEKAELALSMLRPEGYERILELACATGRRALELSRRGFEVVGVEIHGDLLELAGTGAVEEDLRLPYFSEQDPRHLGFAHEFDIVLSLGGGTIGHFGSEDEDLRVLGGIARSLRRGGRLLLQVPNVLRVKANLPPRTWVGEGDAVQMIEQRWNEESGCLECETVSIFDNEFHREGEPVFHERRLYSVEELAWAFERVGLALADVFDEDGDRCAPSEEQRELFVEARQD